MSIELSDDQVATLAGALELDNPDADTLVAASTFGKWQVLRDVVGPDPTLVLTATGTGNGSSVVVQAASGTANQQWTIG